MTDELYMHRCLELAYMGAGKVSPNPMVGCVIVYKGKIIGEGYHEMFGGAHAEVNAVQQVITKYGEMAEALFKEATAYVNLEPCAHFGKTPPCADLLIKHHIKRVVIGNTDPFAEVDGKGIEKLKYAGVNVETDLLKEQCTFFNRRFFTRIKFQRPYLILKWAQTSDGYFASSDQTQKWITGPRAKQLSHLWRAEEDAILVGKRTALIDNPNLTNRSGSGRNPIRILIDRNLDIPNSHHIYNDEAKTIVFNEKKTDVIGNVHLVQMEDMNYYLAEKIAFQLFLMDIQSVIIEGGRNILDQFISSNLWDEARVFTSNVNWGEGIKAPEITGETLSSLQLDEDNLTIIIKRIQS